MKVKKYCMKHVGKIIKSEEYGDIEVIDGSIRINYCKVKVLNNGDEFYVNYWNLKNGSFRSPYKRTVFGVGYVGVGIYSRVNDPVAYVKWNSMMRRCYSEYSKSIRGGYGNAIVCEEWHCFQNFAEWHYKNYIDGFHLDKDLLQVGVEKKVYSPNTCLYICASCNAREVNGRRTYDEMKGHNNHHSRTVEEYSNISVLSSNFRRACKTYGWNIDDFCPVFDDFYVKPDGRKEKKYFFIYKGDENIEG